MRLFGQPEVIADLGNDGPAATVSFRMEDDKGQLSAVKIIF